MASTIEERPGTTDGGGTTAGGETKRRFRLRDMYVERRDGPVTMAERRKAALGTLIAIPAFAAVVAAVQTWARDREVAASWWVALAVVTAVFTVVGFAFPRFSPGGYAHLRNTNWAKESTTSKVVAVIALLMLTAIVIARAVYRMDS